MQLNVATDYAFRLVLNLAMLSEGEIVNGHAIADQEKIPPRFLLKIVRFLTKAGIVRSYRGVDGGYSLGKPAVGISLLDVINAMEGPIAIHRCLKDGEDCNKTEGHLCPVHQALAVIQSQMVDGLSKVNFDRLADEYRKRRGKNG
ncbi:HTH-type transcriptional repressor NsrR [bioreactor metagenome]|uniref:HTH-type transcriptional repressor NsrR n=1 Tax=bioreactor metagenome TaxID=1076179 RepID=A0A644TMI3_9ZZZZ|nr:Rrf2 family transcriptional regulator [Negativicutes bacterium]